MPDRVPFVFLILSLILTASGCRFYPEPPPGWQGDFTARAVLDRAIQAAGEADPADELRDFQASLTITRHDVEPARETSYIVLWLSPGYWSMERTGGGGPTIKFVFDGSTTALLEDGKVVRRDVTLGEIPIDRFLRYLFLLRFFRDGRGDPAELEDAVVRADGSCSIYISKTDEKDREWLLSLDAASLEPRALREMVELPDGRVEAFDTHFAELTKDGRGNEIPRVMSSFVKGALIQEMRIGNLSWNRGLKEIDFRIP